ncbi:S1 domain-containing protein [Microlunatus ginsengisoli]|uniref:TRAM domain-containing protein n=1 Tax=Microlunatus ginsengisoli TaxID=363863 RepID=A0ABP6ZGQ4_9ACTN
MMNDQPLVVGDVLTGTVTKRLAFGVLVESAGTPGLVRGAQAEPGAERRVRVTEFDADRGRFAAELA